MRTETVVMAGVMGRCRWCSATTRNVRQRECHWVDVSRKDLCSNCHELDRMVRTPAGRKFIALVLHPLLTAADLTRQKGKP